MACSLALVLALDISSSVNSREYSIQRDGLAAALRDPEVRSAILNAPDAVRIFAFEWSAVGQQAVIAPWTSLTGDRQILDLADRIAGHVRTLNGGATAIGSALSFASNALASQSECRRRVVDISGDGVNNDGPAPAPIPGLTVNGLVIKGATPDPEQYYRENLIQGKNAFLMIARNGFQDYPDLIKGKLLREIGPPLFIGEAARGIVVR